MAVPCHIYLVKGCRGVHAMAKVIQDLNMSTEHMLEGLHLKSTFSKHRSEETYRLEKYRNQRNGQYVFSLIDIFGEFFHAK